MRTSPPWLLGAVCAVGLVAAMQSAAAAPAAPATDGLPARARTQIEALAAAKVARTPAENKVESPLLTAAQQRRGQAPRAARDMRTGIRTDSTGRARVDVQGTVGPALLSRITALGGVVLHKDADAGVVRAQLPLSAVPSLAALPQVRHIASLAATPIAAGNQSGNRSGNRSGIRSGKERGDERGNERPNPSAVPDDALRRRVAEALGAVGRHRAGSAASGSSDAAATAAVVTEGDAAHGAAEARHRLGVSGVGITVGVLSDGVASLAKSVAAGELPADVRVLPGAQGTGDEGTAMLEIVHDVAPKAKLAFATAFDGAESFADNIRALRAAGADVIVDDVLYLAESPFQDGPIAQAVRDVTNDGALYFSSAGNEGNVNDGTSGTFEGTFTGSAERIGKFAGVANDFDPTARVQVVDPVSPASDGQVVVLQWADPLGAAADDYDLYAVSADGTVLAFSNTVQNGDDDPFEILTIPDGAARLAVTKFGGADRYLQLTMFRGRFRADGPLQSFATAGATRGHSAVPAAFSVAAAPAAGALPFDLEDGDPANPAGPFPAAYTRSQPSERFTSDGPRRMFFTPSGAPLAPGDQVRRKPDLTAADGVKTSVSGFEQFFGTSASAAHAAALAALALSGRPGSSPARVRAALRRTNLDIEAPGRDRDTGTGIMMAGPLLQDLRAKAQPYVVADAAGVATSTDGDAYLEPGETAVLRVPVTNVGDATAKHVSVTVTSSTPGVTVRPAISSYGSVRAGATKSRSYEVTAPRSTPLGSDVTLSQRVRFAGGLTPQTTTGSVMAGQPSSRVVSTAFTGPPVAIPDKSPQGVSVPLRVDGVGPVSRVTFSIDGTGCGTAGSGATAGLQHSYVGDLVGVLRGPDGTGVTLFGRVGTDGENYCRAVFTDSASRRIQAAGRADAPFTGSWQPAEPLSAFVAKPGDGTWTFTVSDMASVDTGVLRAVSVHVSGFEPPPS